MSFATLPEAPPAERPLVRLLRLAPMTVPLLVAVGVFLLWVQFDGGQPVTRWAPGALAILGLLALAATSVPGRWREAPVAVRAATALLAAFTAWSALSIAWADDQGVALEGAGRTVLYLAVFALFALWPQRSSTASWVLGAWTLGVGVLALVTLLRIPAADPARLFVDDRLSEPLGYPNAAAATWLMALWPAVALAASSRVPWPLRGTFAALAVVLADVALLSQSRGSLIAVPLTGLLFLALVPGRLRHVAVLIPIAGAAAAAGPSVVDLGPKLLGNDLQALQDAAGQMTRAVLACAMVAGLIVAAGAAFETLRPPAPATARTVRRAWSGVVAAGVLVALVAGLVVAGNPVDRLDHAWNSFRGGYSEHSDGSRLTSGLGSNRYDFYRVALDVAKAHPVAGVGADNFFQDYLERGRSDETPRYPHSVELRTLAQTGIVGAVLLAAALLAALAGAASAMRRRDPLAVTVAGGATAAFVYWMVHGSADWFWEWAGLGAPAFALLGLACALAPRTPRGAVAPAAVAAEAAPGPMIRRPAALVAGGVLLLVAVGSIAAPWFSERDVREAGAVFARRPFEAYDRLDRASSIDPLTDRPALVEGSIALRYGDVRRARAAFEEALARNPRGAYATLELGAIASVQRDRARARALLDRAVALSPRNGLAREARDVVRSGGTVDLPELNRRILASGARLGAS